MITKKEVQHIAKLARLGLKEREVRRFQKELSSILDYFNLLKELDVSCLKPTTHPAEHFFGEKLRSASREDRAEPARAEVVNKLMGAVPLKEKGHIKVKAILIQ